MTVRITKNQKIGGVPAKSVRDVLRKLNIDGYLSQEWLAEELYWLRVKGVYKHTRRQDCLNWLNWSDAHEYIYYPDCRRHWNASRRASASFINTLVEEGVIELDKRATERKGAPRYKLTESGVEFGRATAAKPVHRKSAEEAIQGLMDRVNIVNEDDRFLFRVTAIVLYGSYLRGAERPADVDLAVELERKISDRDEYEKAHQEYMERKGVRWFPCGGLFVPEDDVLIFLRNRKRTLSLHHMHDFIGMKKHHNFSYQVLVGDQDKITQRLAQRHSLLQDRNQGEYETREPLS